MTAVTVDVRDVQSRVGILQTNVEDTRDQVRTLSTNVRQKLNFPYEILLSLTLINLTAGQRPRSKYGRHG